MRADYVPKVGDKLKAICTFSSLNQRDNIVSIDQGDYNGYVSIESAPENVDLSVRWGRDEPFEYGVARCVLGKWFKRDYANRLADNHFCAAPDFYAPS